MRHSLKAIGFDNSHSGRKSDCNILASCIFIVQHFANFACDMCHVTCDMCHVTYHIAVISVIITSLFGLNIHRHIKQVIKFHIRK